MSNVRPGDIAAIKNHLTQNNGITCIVGEQWDGSLIMANCIHGHNFLVAYPDIDDVWWFCNFSRPILFEQMLSAHETTHVPFPDKYLVKLCEGNFTMTKKEMDELFLPDSPNILEKLL